MTSNAENNTSTDVIAKTKEKKNRAPESVLVVEAYGVVDNAVLARPWASHIGFFGCRGGGEGDVYCVRGVDGVCGFGAHGYFGGGGGEEGGLRFVCEIF